MSKKRILVLTSGLYFNPNSSQVAERFDFLSANLTGDVLFLDSDRSNARIERSGFVFHALILPLWIREIAIIRNPLYWFYILYYSLFKLRGKVKYDAIWVSDPFNIGVVACIAKKISGVPVFMEVIGNLERSIEVDKKKVGLVGALKSKFMRFIAPKTLNYADSVRLVYPTQVDFLEPLTDRGKYSSYAGFVPTHLIEESRPPIIDQEYILLLGGPWHLKGVDLLIKAFNNVAEDYPELFLRVVGYEPNPAEFVAMAAKNNRIILNNNGVDYKEVVKLMSGCKIFVLASRTEAYARVLTEAMISKKPIIASAVDGVPNYICNGINGLLFEKENPGDLEKKLRELLNSPALCSEIAAGGYSYAKNNITEKHYVDNITASIDSAINNHSVIEKFDEP